jgi:hypothetical protein
MKTFALTDGIKRQTTVNPKALPMHVKTGPGFWT